MGFFDENPELLQHGDGNFITKEEKAALAANGNVLEITEIVIRDDPDYGQQFVLTVNIEGGEDGKQLSFSTGSAPTRRRLLEAAMNYLQDPSNAPIRVVLVKLGKAYLLNPAE